MLMAALQAAACGMSLASMWFYGRKNLWGPLLGVLDFLPWAAIAWLTHTYLVLAFDVAVTALSLRTLILWSRPSALSNPSPIPASAPKSASNSTGPGRSFPEPASPWSL